MHLAKKIGHIIGLPFLSVFLSITFQHSLEEKSYKTPPAESGGVPRFEYRAPLLVPQPGVKFPATNAPRTTGERREVETRSMDDNIEHRIKSDDGNPPLFEAPGYKVVAGAYSKSETVLASWYGAYFHGRPMANARPFNMYDPTTVAHKELPLGTRIRATNLKNGMSIIAVVRDRGPYIRGRELDFSRAAAERLGFLKDGIALVHMQVLSTPGKDSWGGSLVSPRFFPKN